MQDLSLHLLDIAQNSIRAKARLVQITLALLKDGKLIITVLDDGLGMAPELLARVQDPFITTREERKVGLGLPLLMQNARLTGGGVQLQSMPNAGTRLTATFYTRHIDCPPMGDIPQTLLTLIIGCPREPDFYFSFSSPYGKASLDTRKLREVLGEVPLSDPEVLAFIQSSLQEEIQQVFGGTEHEIHR